MAAHRRLTFWDANHDASDDLVIGAPWADPNGVTSAGETYVVYGVPYILTSPPSVSVADASVIEGDSGTVDALFVVSLSRAASQTVTVDFSTADGSATASDHDYVPASGTLTYLAGETYKTVAVQVNGDTKEEANESFLFELSNCVGRQDRQRRRHGNHSERRDDDLDRRCRRGDRRR